MTEPQAPEVRAPHPLLNAATIALLLGFCVLFWAVGLHTAAGTPLQTDDAFTLWMIQSKSIIGALKLGADTAPPAFYYLMKANCSLFGFTHLGLRVPSLIAMFVFVLSVFFLLRRYVGDALAGAAAVLPLFETMDEVGYFARPPAFMMAVFALLCLVWAHDTSRKPRLWRSVAIAVLLGFGVSMHFYSVLFVPILMVMEFAWAVENRFIRKAHWIGIFAGACVLLLWLPVIGPIFRMTHGSAKSPAYYAHPSPQNLIKYISNIVFDKSIVIVFIVLLLIGALYRWRQIARRESLPLPAIRTDNLGIVGFAAATVPFFTYGFAAAVTHVFNQRYIVSVALGIAIAVALLVRNLRWPRSLELLLLLVVLTVYAKDRIPALRHPVPTVNDYETAIHLLPGSDPVVLPDGGSFFREQVSTDPVVRARTAYLFLPDGLQDPDTEPARIAHAWHTLRPELAIYNAEDFFAQHKSFYILTWGTPGVGLTPWVRAHMHTEIVSAEGDRTILRVTHD